jgi:hypothetical protein
MDIPTLKQQVVDELNVTAGESKEVHTLAADVVIDALLRSGYRIVPAIVKVESTAINNFESAVVRWCAEGKIEESDVNGPSVIQSLTSEGWIIIPPQ